MDRQAVEDILMDGIVCFGAGDEGETFANMVEGKIEIKFYFDNIIEGKIKNYRICRPSKEMAAGEYIVVTTSQYYDLIKKQLEGYGLEEGKNFTSIYEWLIKNKIGNCDKNLYLYLRERKKVTYQLRYMSRRFAKKGLSYWEYKHATIIPQKKYPQDKVMFGRGGVMDETGNYIETSGIKNRIYGKYNYTVSEYKDERVVYCGYFIKHWGHFLVEAITRLWYFLEEDCLVDKYIFFVGMKSEDLKIEGNFREFFRLLGVLDKIEIINQPTSYREVIVPALSYSEGDYFSQQYKDIFARVVKNAMAETGKVAYKKVYFSRSKFQRRGCGEFGKDMLDKFFERNGFERICPEELTLSEMIAIIQNAEILAAPSGSAAHNALFDKDGKKWIIVERCASNNPCQIEINKMKKLEVSHIDANLSFWPVTYGPGPFIYWCNSKLKEFSEKEKFDMSPLDEFKSVEYLKSLVNSYLSCYHKPGSRWEWAMEELKEAYAESMEEVKMKSSSLYGTLAEYEVENGLSDIYVSGNGMSQ